MALIYPISIASNTILIKLIGSKIDNVSSGIGFYIIANKFNFCCIYSNFDTSWYF